MLKGIIFLWKDRSGINLYCLGKGSIVTSNMHKNIVKKK